MPSSRPITKSGWGVMPAYSRATAMSSSPCERGAPSRPRELAVLEVADRVRGEQPVALEERSEEGAIGRRSGRSGSAGPAAGDRDVAISRPGPAAARLGCRGCSGRRAWLAGGAERRLERRLPDPGRRDDRGDELGRGDVERRARGPPFRAGRAPRPRTIQRRPRVDARPGSPRRPRSQGRSMTPARRRGTGRRDARPATASG